MFLTGISDEAGGLLSTQIEATKALGWTTIEARSVQIEGFPTANFHDIPDAAFDRAVAMLEHAGLGVCCFGSTIANWGKRIDDPSDTSMDEARRAIPRMKRLGTRFVRIMSYAVREDSEDQMEQLRFSRLRDLVRLFRDAGLQPVHENCMNYGGMGWPFALRLLENVPGLRWVFDTGNPLFNADRSKAKPWPKQDPWEFYTHIKPFIDHVHVKDVIWNTDRNEPIYTHAGEGHARVRDILTDLLASGYTGGISIEPHIAVVFHDASVKSDPENQLASYIDYGRRFESLVRNIQQELGGRTGAGGSEPAQPNSNAGVR